MLRQPFYFTEQLIFLVNGHLVCLDYMFLYSLLNPQPDLSDREFQAFTVAFRSMNRLIDSFRVTLSPSSDLDPKQSSTPTVLLTRALVDAATIKLHSTFSKQHCVTAARDMVSFSGLNLEEVKYINPIMGVSRRRYRAITLPYDSSTFQTLWMTACHVFIDEIARLRSPPDTWPPGAAQVDEEELTEKLRDGIASLSLFSEDSALMSTFKFDTLNILSPYG